MCIRRYAVILFLLLAVSPQLWATADVHIAWDPMPSGQAWVEVRAYELVGKPPTPTLVGTVTTPATVSTLTLYNVPAGTHTYIVRSWNGQQESVDSNTDSATILTAPLAPGHETITIIVH